MKKKVTKPVAVESVFDLNTDSQMWYNIPGYNGYEISDQGYVRSMKNFRKYPYGMLIRPKVTKHGDTYFELSDDFNRRQRLSVEEIWDLAMKNPYKNNSYPRSTWVTDNQSRNPLAFSYKRMEPKKPETYSYVEFPVIKDIPEDITIKTVTLKSPIYFFDEKGDNHA